jgi:hypothetical protein
MAVIDMESGASLRSREYARRPIPAVLDPEAENSDPWVGLSLGRAPTLAVAPVALA